MKALKCYPQVYKMLMVGKPAPSVALYIQDERMEYTDVKLTSLSTMLNDYRRDELGKGALFDRMPHLVVSAAREFTDRLSELKELTDLYDQQRFRYDNACADAEMNGERDPHIEKMAKALQDTINLTHKIKMDLNLTGSRDLGTLTISAEKMERIREKYGDAGERVFSSPVSRGRIDAAITLALKAAKVATGDDGSPVIDIESDKSGVEELDGEESEAKK